MAHLLVDYKHEFVCKFFISFFFFLIYFKLLIILIIAPIPVPDGWNDGFIALTDNKIYFSSSGDYADFELFQGIDYSKYEPWAVAYNNNEWAIKLGALPGVATNDGTVHDIFFMTFEDGLTYSNPINSTFQSFADYGLSYSSSSNNFITATTSGIIGSTDAETWNVISEEADAETLVFNNLVCSGSRCVGVGNDGVAYDSDNSGQDFKNIIFEGITQVTPNYPVVSLNTSSPDSAIFIIGATTGQIVRSDSYKNWKNVGTGSNAKSFLACTELVTTDDSYFANCQYSLLESEFGEDWFPIEYSNLGTQLNGLASHDKVLAAFSNNVIYSSDDGDEWKQRVELVLQPTDAFIISNIKHIHDEWIIFGQNMWTEIYGYNSGDAVEIPMIIKSDDLDSFDIYASNSFVVDAIHSEELDDYIGAGQFGLYRSDDLFQWQLMSDTIVNVECSQITGGGLNFMALCSNYNDTSLESTLFITNDGGATWDNYYSPCELEKESSGYDNIICDSIVYIDSLQGFFVFAQNPIGLMYFASAGDYNWGKVDINFAFRIYDIAASDSSFVVLGQDAFYKGSISEFQDHVSGSISKQYPYFDYNPSPSEYPISPGYITTEPKDSSFEVPSTFDYTDPESWRSAQYSLYHDSDSNGSNAGMIVGIIFGILAFLIIIAALIPATIFAKRKYDASKHESEQTKLLNEENDML